MTNELIISKYLSGNTSIAEKTQVEKRLMVDAQFKSDFDKYQEIWKSVKVANLDESYDVEQEWSEFRDKIREGARSRTKIIVWRSLSAAASIAIMMVAYWWFFMNESIVTEQVSDVQEVISIPVEEPVEIKSFEIATTDYDKTVILPDSTVVNLKVGSKIVYTDEFNIDNREIYLEGAALFDVTRDTTCSFLINTNNTITKVLGTSFLLRAYPAEDSVSIMVRSGHVEFGSKKSSTYSLKKGDFASYSRTKDSVEVAYEYIEETLPEPEIKKVINRRKPRKKIEKDDGVLTVDYDWKKNVINLSKVEGLIVNESKSITYDNVRLKVTYYTDKRGKKASTYFLLEESISPGDTVEFRKTLMLDWLSKTSALEVEIDTAEIKQ